MQNKNNIFCLRKFGRETLTEFDYRTSALETDLIIAKFLGVDKIYLELNPNEIVNEETSQKILNAMEKRKNAYPIAYILGEKEFMDYSFFIDEGILIPRDDTGTLIEAVFSEIKNKNKKQNGLEIGTGSGIISIMLLAKHSNLNMTACDINEKSLVISNKNAKYVERQSNKIISNRLELIKSDLFDELKDEYKFDFIVSNPPYIETEVVDTLDRGVKDYEPREALDGGLDGIDFYRKIIDRGYDFLEEDGFFAFEIGYNQYESVSKLMEEKKIKRIKLYKDLSNLNRAIIGYK